MAFSPFARLGHGWRITKRVVNESLDDNILDYSAALAYYFLFSLFPLILFLASLLSQFHQQSLLQRFLWALQHELPSQAGQLVISQLQQVLKARHLGLLSFGTILLLYSASQGFSGLINGLNAAYEVVETRSYLHRVGLALLLTCTAGVFIVLALVGLLAEQTVVAAFARPLHLSYAIVYVWPVLRWAWIICFLVLAIVLLFRAAPNVHTERCGILPGAVTALVLWLLTSIALGAYIDHVSNYSAIYGSLGAVIGLMMWFYVLALSLLLGAEVHSEILKEQGIAIGPQRVFKSNGKVEVPAPPIPQRPAA